MMRPLAPVRIRAVEHGGWRATCRVCAEHTIAGGTFHDWRHALAWAHGHMHVRHPGWHYRKPTASAACGTGGFSERDARTLGGVA